MDPRLIVNDPPREGVPPDLAGAPLLTVAWRVLKAEQARRSEETRQARAAERARLDALACLAEEVFKLRRMAAKAGGEPGAGAQLQLAAGMEAALANLNVFILAPEGEVYDNDLMELIDNLAQQPDPGISQPVVMEVFTPTILHAGDILRRGKAVIRVPARAET